MGSHAIELLAKKAQTAVNYASRQKEAAKLQNARMTMVALVGVGSAVAGYVDGRYQEADDAGVMQSPHFLGMPMIPVLGFVAAVVGMSDLVPGGEHLAALGIGAVSGSVYSLTREKGIKLAADAANG